MRTSIYKSSESQGWWQLCLEFANEETLVDSSSWTMMNAKASFSVSNEQPEILLSNGHKV